MTTATATRPDFVQSNPVLWLNVVAGWQAFVSLASLAGIYFIWQSPTTPYWLQVLTTIILLLAAAASGASAFFIPRRQHVGRVLSLAVNYLGFVACLIGAAQALGIFISFNDLANTFGNGLPFLFIMFLGYLVSAFGDRYEDNQPAKEKMFRQAGQLIMLVSLVIFLFAINVLSGLLALAQRYDSPMPFGLTAGVIFFAAAMWLMWQQTLAETMNANNSSTEMLNGYLFLSPNLLGFLIFFGGPLLFSFYVSFTDWDAFGTKNFVGLDNYRRIINLTIVGLASPDQRAADAFDIKVYDELTRFSILGSGYVIGAQDKLFWLSLRNTLLFVIMAVPLSVIPALLLANILNSKLPGMKIYRAIYFIPSIAAVVGIALIWQLLYNATIGYINYAILMAVTLINTVFNANLVDPQIRWLSDSRTAMLSLVIMSAWQTMGFNTVLFLAGLQNIPRDLYEAATVDGANKMQQFRFITIPMLAPTTFFVLTTTTIQAMQLFDQVFILINPPSGPNNSTLTVVLYLYQNGFQRFQQGYASAIAWVLFAGIFGLTLLQFQHQRASAYEG